MSSHSLQSASTYLNNLLLSRGLLQDGRAINFALSDGDSSSIEPTMSKIINLVHDLVLRRDQDAEQREMLANTLKTSRAEENQRVLDLQRLQNKNTDLNRAMSVTEAHTRTLQASVRRAETQARELKEQMLKMKSTLDQVRAKCISDVRKRDTEIEKLKNHINSLQRGKREASGLRINAMNPQTAATATRERRTGQESNSVTWSLEQETSEFLAALVNETTTENVALRDTLNGAIATLRDLTGFELVPDQEEEDDGIGIPGQYRKSHQKAVQSNQETALVSCEALANNMNAVIEHSRSILRDPSFVPIEEVQLRDQEIVKLRQGWEKMAIRWKEAVVIMDSWRRKMVEGGQSFDIGELSDLGFGRSVATLPNGQPVLGQDEELSSLLYDSSFVCQENPEQSSTSEQLDPSTIPDEESSNESELDIPPELSPKRLAASPARRGLKLLRPGSTLHEMDGNGKTLASEDSKPSSLAHSADSGLGSLEGSIDEDPENDTFHHKLKSRIPDQISNFTEVAASEADSRTQECQKENIAPMSVYEKLAIVEAEAQEARAQIQPENPQKRKRSQRDHWRKASRRRSTLSPEELAALMGAR